MIHFSHRPAYRASSPFPTSINLIDHLLSGVLFLCESDVLFRNTRYRQKYSIKILPPPQKNVSFTKAFDSSWAVLSLICHQIWASINGLRARDKNQYRCFFVKKRFFANNFWNKKASSLIRVPACSSLHGASKHVATWWPERVRSIFLFQVNVTWGQMLTQIGHAAYQSMRNDNTGTMGPRPCL